MKIQRTFLILTLSLFTAQWAWAKFNLEGLLPADKRKLQRTYPSLLKGVATPEKADRLVRTLMLTDHYETVSAYKKSNGDISIHAQALRTIGKVSIEGNRKFSNRQILDSTELEQGKEFQRGQVLKAGEKIKEMYGRQGYFNAKIEVKFRQLESGGVHIIMNITENSPCRVESIRINTQNLKLKKTLLKKVKRYLKDPFTEKTVSGIEGRIKSYFKDEKYLLSKLRQKKVDYNENKTKAWLNYEIDKPYRYVITFQGMKFFSSRSEQIKTLKLKEFNNSVIDAASEMAQIIRTEYLKNGFPHIRVTSDIKQNNENYTQNIRFKINEGPRVRIEEIEVSGRISRPSKYYADFILENSSDEVESKRYVRKDLEFGYKNLVTELRNQGYLRAKIQSARVEYSDNRAKAKILILMNEGPLTQVRKIEFRGAKAFKQVELIKVLKIKNNSPLRLNKLEESIEELKQFYTSRGYIEMRIDNEDENLVRYNNKGALADIIFQIYEGPKVVVSSIETEGLSFTKRSVVLNEISFKEGDILTPEHINLSRTRLNQLGIFASADIRTLEAGSKISDRTVIVSVRERNPGVFKVGAGITDKRGQSLRGYTGVSYNNLGGTARAILARINLQEEISEVKYLENELIISYLEPFLFSRHFKRLRGRMSFVRAEEVKCFEDSDVCPNATTIEESTSVTTLLEKQFGRNYKLFWKFWSLDTVRNFQEGVQTANFDDSVVKIVTIGPRFEMDFTDNILLPTRGTFSSIALDYSAPALGSSQLIHFYRLESAIHHHIPLFKNKKYVWANGVRGGHVKNLSGRSGSGIPTKHAFFLGGSTTIRGFGGTINDRIPSSAEFPTQGTRQLVIPNWSNYYLYKSEFRFPIYGDIGGVLFYDAGSVAIADTRFIRPFRQGYGIGIRINTPVGPISLDYGRKASRVDSESENFDHIHFSIGTF